MSPSCVSLSVDLEDEGFGHFEIDSETGDIKTTEIFTQNTEPFYTLRVTARDGGAAPREDTAVVHVQVQTSLHVILLLLDYNYIIYHFVSYCSIGLVSWNFICCTTGI